MTDAQLKPCPFCGSANVKSGGDAPTDALAEHDAKVRADALREARDKISGEVFAMPNGTTMDRSYNLAVKDCLAAIQALIEGE